MSSDWWGVRNDSEGGEGASRLEEAHGDDNRQAGWVESSAVVGLCAVSGRRGQAGGGEAEADEEPEECARRLKAHLEEVVIDHADGQRGRQPSMRAEPEGGGVNARGSVI